MCVYLYGAQEKWEWVREHLGEERGEQTCIADRRLSKGFLL